MSEFVKMKTMDGNEATAYVAYRVSEISAIYPITPSSTMGEFADQWASEGKQNIWGAVPMVVEMQSEGGASGALHGVVQAGSLGTTYTASQGLLLMIPNMYKLAGELTPTVIHVSARTLAAHALSIFGDHSDVMAVRQTGFALLSSNSVQEAHDMALIAHAATLETRIPFLHFFDGFRTSHEVSKIALISEDQMRAMMSDELILAHRRRALNPSHPVIRGTAQNPDVFFQSREACNTFYTMAPDLVEKVMDRFEQVVGRRYHLMDYVGHPQAETIVIAMGSGAETIQETVDYLVERGEKVGLLKVRLYRPFSMKHFLAAIPTTVKTIGVLDRTKEPGSVGEPMYQDVCTAFCEAAREGTLLLNSMPKIISGRYGLSSKEFTPAMAKAVLAELKKEQSKNHFTIGINDDVTFTSLEFDPSFVIARPQETRAIFFGLGADGTVGANKNTIKIIGEETDNYAQGYFVYDSKKSGSRTVSHLRFGPKPIHSPYLIDSANFIGCHQFNFIEKLNVLKQAEKGATFLINSPYSANDVWQQLPKSVQKTIIEKQLSFYVIDAYRVAKETGMGNRTNTIMQTCFFAISGVLPKAEAIQKIKDAIQKTYGKKGEEVVRKNFAAVDATLANLVKVVIPSSIDATSKDFPPIVSEKAPEFVRNVEAMILADRGDELPVSAFPVDGTYPSGTAQWEKRNISLDVANWDSALCIQCGRCSMVCPHGVIRVKRFDKSVLSQAPAGFKSAAVKEKGQEAKCFTLQVYLEDCTGCGLCYQACPAKNKEKPEAKAIMILPKEPVLETERKNIDFFEGIESDDPHAMNTSTLIGLQYLPPYFEFSGACTGCGETPYVKLVSQLFGDRMLVANATGCSSIYGGNLPTTPWTMDKNGRGPAWANSLFEDNAEFGLGFRLAETQHKAIAIGLLMALKETVGVDLANEIMAHTEDKEDLQIAAQRLRIKELVKRLKGINEPRATRLTSLADHLVHHSIWIMGGDGWAYDIGFGGLDHVMASGKDVNILVLDTEVYSNTGGQASKATPLGAIARFAEGGKAVPKKELAFMAMTYSHIYVAQISMGANPLQTLKAIREAEAFNGPSLVIAYSHCITHGIDMRKGMELQRAAVECGYWPLFRYNTDRVKEGLNPFMLDSKKPVLALKDYIYQETRFKALVQSHPELAEKYLNEEQDVINRQWEKLERTANGG